MEDKKKCKHEWDALQLSHTISYEEGERSIVVIRVCHKCDSAQKKSYDIIPTE